SLTGKDADVLTELADNEVVPYFERQEGVASVTVEGAKEREIQLILDEAALNTHGIGADEVTQALQSSNQSTSVGTIDKGKQDLQESVSNQYETIDDMRETIIQTEEGKKLHISDIAELKDRFKKEGSRTLVNGEHSVVLSFLKNSDANTVDVARAIDAS